MSSLNSTSPNNSLFEQSSEKRKDCDKTEEDNEKYETKKRKYSQCEVCSSQESKYTCPGCNMRYCCLDCFKNHKTSSGCSGKRDVTKFIELRDFSEQSLRSDYNFLENMDSQTIHWSRMRIQEKIDSHSYQYHHPRVRELQYKAIQKGIRMELMPQGMSRRENNTSYFNKKTDKIFWRVEFIFDQEMDSITTKPAQLVENHVCEDVKISDIIPKYLDKEVTGSAKTRDKLQKYASQFELSKESKNMPFRFLIQVEGTFERMFYNVNPSLPLREALKDMVILEYPIFHTILSDSVSEYRIISEEELKDMNKKRDDKLKEKKEKRQAFIEKKNKYEERMAEKQEQQKRRNNFQRKK